MTKSKKNFVSGAMLLAVCGLIAKVISALYRIPLTNILSAEGMGMYQLIFSIYALVLALASSGIPIAISRLVAEKNALGKSSKNISITALIIIMAFSVIMALVLILFCNNIAQFQGNTDIKNGYYVIAPAIIFVAGIAFFRGWFQGHLNVVPTAVSQIIEQIIKLTAGISFAYALLPRGVIYAVYGALLGVTLSEVVTFIYMIIAYIVAKRKKRAIAKKLQAEFKNTVMNIESKPIDAEFNFKENSKEILKIAFPIALSGIIIPLSQFIDSILIVNILKSNGMATDVATAQYGIFSGTVMSLVNMPIVLTLSIAVVIVPVVSANRVNRNLSGIIQKSATAVKLSYVIGLPASLLMFVYARPILNLLYPALSTADIELAVTLLRIASFAIIFQAQMQIFTALLQALDRTYVPVKNLFTAVLVKTIISIIALKTIGINGAAVGTLSLGIVATILNIFTFNYLVGKNIKLVQNISTILVSSVIMTVVALIFYFALNEGLMSLIIGGIVSAIVYCLLLLLFKVFDKGELDGVPILKYFDKFSTKIRFWENK